MDYVGDGVVGAAYRDFEVRQILLQRLDVALVAQQELHVVAAGEPQVAVAVLVRQRRQVADEVGGGQPRRSTAHAIQSAGIAGMGQYSRLQCLVVLPLAVVLLHQGMKELLKMRRSYVCFSFYICCHQAIPPVTSKFTQDSYRGKPSPSGRPADCFIRPIPLPYLPRRSTLRRRCKDYHAVA
ncbi:hypothetical protein BMS3Abin01_00856 [bacterium BMS3Abin01]|nr:hypothetical protein BMS3Abin01_00856 [bacterium BMS3Abin01]